MMDYIYILVILFIYTEAQITEPPVNTAVNIGQQARLRCTANVASNTLQWRNKLNETDSLIWQSSDPDIVLDDRFIVDVDQGQDKYDLIVKSAQPDVGGQYYVRLDNVPDTHVELIVLGTLACLPSEPKKTQEGAEIVLHCETGYYGYKDPTMKWYFQGTEIPSRPYFSEENDWKRMQSNFSARPEHDGTIYDCQLYFNPAEGEDTQPPVHSDNCTTATYIVYYAVQNVTIHPQAPDDGTLVVDVGDSFICTGVGKETPNFDWYCKERTYIVEGAILPVTEELLGDQECICRAYNYVFGQLNEVYRNVTFTAGVSSGIGINSSILTTVFNCILTLFIISFMKD